MNLLHKPSACRLAALLLLPLCLAALGGCGGQNAAAPTETPSNPQAAAAAAQKGAASDQSSAAARAESEARGKAEIAARQGQAAP